LLSSVYRSTNNGRHCSVQLVLGAPAELIGSLWLWVCGCGHVWAALCAPAIRPVRTRCRRTLMPWEGFSAT
jgi:hypothetical protein